MIYIKKLEVLSQVLDTCPIVIDHSITQVSILENGSKPFGIIRFEDSKTGWEKSIDGNGWIEVLRNRTVLSIVYPMNTRKLIEIEL
jgi:hypothetical protein